MAKKRLRFHWVHLVCFFDHLLRSAKLHLWDRDAECQAALATPLACSTHLPHISVCSSFPLCRACRASWSSLGSDATRAVATVAGFSENNLHSNWPAAWKSKDGEDAFSETSTKSLRFQNQMKLSLNSTHQSPAEWCTVCSSCVAKGTHCLSYKFRMIPYSSIQAKPRFLTPKGLCKTERESPAPLVAPEDFDAPWIAPSRWSSPHVWKVPAAIGQAWSVEIRCWGTCFQLRAESNSIIWNQCGSTEKKR